MTRLLGPCFLVAAAMFVAVPHRAGASPQMVAAVVVPGDSQNDEADRGDAPHVRTKDAGAVDGEVTSVDYRTSHFTVRAGGMTYDVVVLPSTDFEGPTNAFRGITDIKKGAHLSVMLSQRATTYVAQIIHLR